MGVTIYPQPLCTHTATPSIDNSQQRGLCEAANGSTLTMISLETQFAGEFMPGIAYSVAFDTCMLVCTIIVLPSGIFP